MSKPAPAIVVPPPRMAESDELRRFDTIHIATHALVGDDRPEQCALVLSEFDLPSPLEAALHGDRVYTGCIRAGSIARDWKLDADLVALSACDTGLGRDVPGEGYIGFAHALFQAGARSLLVSLWKVEDRSTSLLMRRFYENRLGRRAMSKAAALQEAKRWLRSWTDAEGTRPYAHPYFWAGFVLMGDRG